MDTVGEGERVNWEMSIGIYTLPCVNRQWEAAAQHKELSSALCDDQEGQDQGWG